MPFDPALPLLVFMRQDLIHSLPLQTRKCMAAAVTAQNIGMPAIIAITATSTPVRGHCRSYQMHQSSIASTKACLWTSEQRFSHTFLTIGLRRTMQTDAQVAHAVSAPVSQCSFYGFIRPCKATPVSSWAIPILAERRLDRHCWLAFRSELAWQ